MVEKFGQQVKDHVLLRGSPRWTRILSNHLLASGQTPQILPWRHHDGIPYLFRFRFLPFQSKPRVFHQVMIHLKTPLTSLYFRVAKARGLKTIAHWIGSDVVWLRELSKKTGVPRFLHEHVDRHLADSPKLAAELREFGIDATVIRLLPTSIKAEIEELPEKPSALAYIRKGHDSFCGYEIIADLARSFPDMTFLIVAHDGEGISDRPSNIEFLGMVADMEPVYRRSTVLIRICEHDSLSAMVLEALARGRYAIYSEEFPHTMHATSLFTAEVALRNILSMSEPNVDGAAYVAANFDPDSEIAKLLEIYRQLGMS